MSASALVTKPNPGSRDPSVPDLDWKDVLSFAEETIMRWDLGASQTLLWHDNPDEAHGYLQAVDNIRFFLEQTTLRKSWGSEADYADCVDRAETAIQFAMARLEEELRGLLERESESVDPNWLFDPIDGPSSSFAFGQDPANGGGENGGVGSDEEPLSPVNPLHEFNFTIPMLPPEAVPDLFDIASRMLVSGYATECCQVYISVRKSVVEESLCRLGLPRFSIEEVQRMDWETLEENMGMWKKMAKPAVRVILRSEKQLCRQVFAGFESIQESTFAEVSRAAVSQLLNFGESVAISRRSPEKLFKILDMYDMLRKLLPDIDSIFSGAPSASIKLEVVGIAALLGEAAKGTFAAFENAVQRDIATTPIFGGTVHPLTRYVLNYLRLLVIYSDTLNHLLSRTSGNTQEPILPPDRSPSLTTLHPSPLSLQVTALMAHLERNLEEKSKLYKDPSLSCIFLMNNIHYIVQKVRNCEIRTFLGDDWIRRHSGKVLNYHSSYQRTAWTKVLHCLRDEGIRVNGSFSSGVSMSVLRDRFKSFNAAFEEVHRNQSTWIVQDYQLSAELRISVEDLLLPAYRAFVGRFHSFLESDRNPEKYMKYTPEDLEARLNELFTGMKYPGNYSNSSNRKKY